MRLPSRGWKDGVFLAPRVLSRKKKQAGINPACCFKEANQSISRRPPRRSRIQPVRRPQPRDVVPSRTSRQRGVSPKSEHIPSGRASVEERAHVIGCVFERNRPASPLIPSSAESSAHAPRPVTLFRSINREHVRDRVGRVIKQRSRWPSQCPRLRGDCPQRGEHRRQLDGPPITSRPTWPELGSRNHDLNSSVGISHVSNVRNRSPACRNTRLECQVSARQGWYLHLHQK